MRKEFANRAEDREEYWRPPTEELRSPIARPVPVPAENCRECGSELVMGSRFCHLCGTRREALASHTGFDFGSFLRAERIRQALGLSAMALVALVLGSFCLLAALFTGIIYSMNTVLDWQAVQVWRLEWLLAAVACFVAGILLKK